MRAVWALFDHDSERNQATNSTVITNAAPKGWGERRGWGWGVGGALEIGCFVYWLITASLPNELYSCSLLKKKLIFISPRAAGVLSHAAVLTKIRHSWKKPHRDKTGSLGEESVHLFKTDVFKEGQSFLAFLGLSFILGPVAQITWLL